MMARGRTMYFARKAIRSFQAIAARWHNPADAKTMARETLTSLLQRSDGKEMIDERREAVARGHCPARAAFRLCGRSAR